MRDGATDIETRPDRRNFVDFAESYAATADFVGDADGVAGGLVE